MSIKGRETAERAGQTHGKTKNMNEHDRKYVTLIGTPLRQSYAARMQNRAYAAMGVNLHYTYCEAGTEHLGEIVAGLRYMPCAAGFAVTKPNKVKVLEYLDRVDALCGRIGACNTVVKAPDGALVGYNTDAEGFMLSMRGSGVDVRGKTAFCIGSGGAGRAIAFALAGMGCGRIYLCSNYGISAAHLANDLDGAYPDIAAAVGAGDTARIAESDIVVNASGVGMGASEGISPIPAALLHEGQFCFDACYNPPETKFLADARERGCRTMNGLEMSLYQGARQIELWTGKRPPLEIMREEIC